MEAIMPAFRFDDSAECLGQVRQMLGALRLQLRDENEIQGHISISLLVTTNILEDKPINGAEVAH